MSRSRLVFAKLFGGRALATQFFKPQRHLSSAAVGKDSVATKHHGDHHDHHGHHEFDEEDEPWQYRQNHNDDIVKSTYKNSGYYWAGLMWWWILYHFWHEPEMVFGEWEYPDPSKWTDEQLGIPPDDYEEE